MEKLRIVHCFRSPVGGIFRHVRDLCEAQVAAGHDVGIVCDSTTGGAYEDRLFQEISDSLPLGMRRVAMQRHVGFGDLAAARRTYRVIRAMKADVLHGHGAKGGFYARLFGTIMRLAGSRVVRIYSPHGGSLHYDETTPMGRLVFFAERCLDRCCDRMIFVSEYERKSFRGKIGEPRTPASIVYNGLQPREFEPVEPAATSADFLYIGMMRDLKGPDIFLDALAEAEGRSGRQLTACMIGDGDDLEKYVAQAKRLGLASRVRFHPAMPARQAFALARIVVVPSRAEAMPYIVLEALAAGKPMIATAVGGIPEIFADHHQALVTPEPAAVATKMTAAVADEAAFARGMPQPAELETRFGAEVMTKAIEAIYLAALARG